MIKFRRYYPGCFEIRSAEIYYYKDFDTLLEHIELFKPSRKHTIDEDALVLADGIPIGYIEQGLNFTKFEHAPPPPKQRPMTADERDQERLRLDRFREENKSTSYFLYTNSLISEALSSISKKINDRLMGTKKPRKLNKFGKIT